MITTLENIHTGELISFNTLWDAAEYCCTSISSMKALSEGRHKTVARRWRIVKKEWKARRYTKKQLVEEY